MNMRLTDKERLLVLEARIAALEEENAALRTWGCDRETAHAREDLIDRIRPILRAGDRQAGGRSTAAILLQLLDKPGHYRSRDELYALCQRISGRDGAEDGRALAVRMSRLRHALANLGLPDVLRFQTQSGWVFTPEAAERVRSVVFTRAGFTPDPDCRGLQQ